MKRSLIDTDVFTEILKSKNAKVTQVANSYRAVFGRLTLSCVTVMEVVKGFHKSGQTDRLKLFLDRLPLEEVLLFDIPSAELGGRIFADLERTGQTIGRADPMIAGIALRHGLVLVTANTAHFRRIADLGYSLELENWREEKPGA